MKGLYPEGSRESPTIDLSSLVYRLGQHDCLIKLNRAYALLSLAKDGYKFPIDYGIDCNKLFRRIMMFCMESRTLDNLLLFGATLIKL